MKLPIFNREYASFHRKYIRWAKGKVCPECGKLRAIVGKFLIVIDLKEQEELVGTLHSGPGCILVPAKDKIQNCNWLEIACHHYTK